MLIKGHGSQTIPDRETLHRRARSRSDLRQIWRYLLGAGGLDVADRIQTELVDTFEALADFPGRGHKRPDLTSRNVLFLSVYQYMIAYRATGKIEIVAVLHGKRDLKRLLKSRLTK
jgi:plasmid stabilization system protein ParE